MVDLSKTVAWFDQATWVTTSGHVLKLGTAGVVIWDEMGDRAILTIDEVSDDATIDVFLRPAGDIVRSTFGDDGTHEICIDKAVPA